jgi:hypothetical protein
MPDCLPHEHPLAMLRMFDPNALPLTESSEKEKAGDRSSKTEEAAAFLAIAPETLRRLADGRRSRSYR